MIETKAERRSIMRKSLFLWFIAFLPWNLAFSQDLDFSETGQPFEKPTCVPKNLEEIGHWFACYYEFIHDNGLPWMLNDSAKEFNELYINSLFYIKPNLSPYVVSKMQHRAAIYQLKKLGSIYKDLPILIGEENYTINHNRTKRHHFIDMFIHFNDKKAWAYNMVIAENENGEIVAIATFKWNIDISSKIIKQNKSNLDYVHYKCIGFCGK